MRGTSSGIRFVSASSISENITWIIEQSPTDRRLLTIRNKDTGKYLYIETDSLKVDDTASTYISHRWRFVQPDDYTPVTADNVSFDDINMSIQSTYPIVIHRDFGVDLAIPEYDFIYTVTLDTELISISDTTIIAQGYQVGIAIVEVVHKTTATEFSFVVEVRDPFERAYFFENKGSEKYMQLDDNGEDFMEQHNFSGEKTQRWQISSNEDGYYKVKNLDSNKYLTSPDSTSSGEEIIQAVLSDSIANRQLWRFTQLSDGSYKIQSKAHEGSNLYLTVGVDVQQGGYSNDTDYRDEWIMIPTSLIIQGVPTSLRSTSTTHLCIPCAITNVAGYWSQNGYSGFECSTPEQQEARAIEVQNAMAAAGSHKANAYIPYGAAVFSHIDENGVEYVISCDDKWAPEFSKKDIVEEIVSGRPFIMGFDAAVFGIGHLTVCAGYEFNGDRMYVYVSDAIVSGYIKYELVIAEDNCDFICKMRIVEVEE